MIWHYFHLLPYPRYLGSHQFYLLSIFLCPFLSFLSHRHCLALILSSLNYLLYMSSNWFYLQLEVPPLSYPSSPSSEMILQKFDVTFLLKSFSGSPNATGFLMPHFWVSPAQWSSLFSEHPPTCYLCSSLLNSSIVISFDTPHLPQAVASS